MGMNLNAERKAYEVFEGRNVEQMPNLVADGRTPMNVAQLMQKRLDYRNGPKDVKSAWMDNYFDTGDAVIYHPNGDVKIVLDSQTLKGMIPKSQRNGGALVLTEDAYKSLDGEVFRKGKLGKTDEWMSKADVKAHPVWKVLARNQGLLNDYTDYIFAEGKEKFNYDKAMGVFSGSCNGNAPEMRAFFVGGLGSESYLSGGNGLGDGDGRLVGVAPEALSASGNGISNIQRYSLEDVEKAKVELSAFTQVRPELLTRTTSLISKL